MIENPAGLRRGYFTLEFSDEWIMRSRASGNDFLFRELLNLMSFFTPPGCSDTRWASLLKLPLSAFSPRMSRGRKEYFSTPASERFPIFFAREMRPGKNRILIIRTLASARRKVPARNIEKTWTWRFTQNHPSWEIAWLSIFRLQTTNIYYFVKI